jgi:subtilase family serine protease
MRRLALAATLGAALVAAILSAPASSASPAARLGHGSERTCPAAPAGFAACLARVVTDASGKPAAAATPSGYGPADLRSAYNLTSSGSSATTVAIVDAYDDPTAEQDLITYRNQFGLPACTTANGCFKKVNQTGGTNYPRKNAGWATEISLDLDMASAICPNCHILLVEATSASFSNLATAVSYAASVPGVVAISNSYGGSDSTNIANYENAAAKGIAVTASTGDGGYGVEAPASFTHVVAVGGTSLKRASTTRGWAETAWSGAGSGCSTKNANPGWQTGTSCTKKANADVSAVADPYTGVAVYDSTSYQGRSGWQVYGGTSVSSPIIASIYALADNFGTYAGQYTWGNRTSLNDVTSGSNGTCTTSVWCTAGVGWDGPTGLGTPNGLGAF